MDGEPYHHPKLGPFTINLIPCDGTNTFGRSAFRIHGDNKTHNASEGCLVLGPGDRKSWWDSGEREFDVI